MKTRYENVKQDCEFFEAELKKAKKLNKLLYVQNLNYSQKHNFSDSSLSSALRKGQIGTSLNSSKDKLMVSLKSKSKNSTVRKSAKNIPIDMERIKQATSNPTHLKRGKSSSGIENMQCKNFPNL